MIFAMLVAFLPVLWFLPWWAVIPVAAAFGWWSGPHRGRALQCGLAAGLAWEALAFIKDGHNHGIVSQRISSMFNLPSQFLIFQVVLLVGFITAFLFFQAGAVMSGVYRARTISRK